MGKRERENSGGVMRESGTRGVKSRNEFREIRRGYRGLNLGDGGELSQGDEDLERTTGWVRLGIS